MQKKIKAKVTVLFGEDGMEIRIKDAASRVEFVRVQLDPVAACQALGRLCGVQAVECEVAELEKVGLVHECRTLEFPLGENLRLLQNGEKELALSLLPSCVPEGWTADTSFLSQTSFFTKDGMRYARTIIRRWVAAEGGTNDAEE